MIPKIDLDLIDQELCRRDYGYYVQYVHQGEYTHGKFTRYLTAEVQKFVETVTGNAYDILLLSVPPQHSKSTSITETLPSWYLGKNPKHRVIEVSYNEDFAKRFVRVNSDKIDKFGKKIFDISIGSPNTANDFKLTNGIGSFISRGIMSGITGEPCNLMIIDDPIKNAEEANSQVIRAKHYAEWLGSCKPRLAAGAKIILIMTRWHEDDLYGKLLETEQNIRRINFTIECETDTDELGRVRGETLFPEAPISKDRKWWDDFKRSYITTEGTRAMNALYYGRPTGQEGSLLKRSWFIDNLYTRTPNYYYKVISVDASFKDANTSDPVSIQVWVKNGVDCYLLERHNKIMGFVDTVQKINQVITDHPDYNAILVEDKANGSAIIDVMSRKYRSVIPVKVIGGKESRASAVSPMIEANNVHLKANDPGQAEMIEECVSFPNGKHDDDVDCMTQALNKLKDISANPPVKTDDYEDQLNSVLGFM